MTQQNTLADDVYDTLRLKLSTAQVGDVLDVMGYRQQFLPPNITPLKAEMKIVGRAMPVREADYLPANTDEPKGPLAKQAFGLMIDALDDLKENEVYIATGALSPYALWGGLMSTRAKYLKAAGAVLNGYVRDSADIEKLGFPVFSVGLYAQDQSPRGKVIDYRCPIEIGGVRIMPGDLIFGDREGVLIIPKSAEEEAIRRALEKASDEGQFEAAVQNGMSVRDAFNKFGVM